MSELRVRIPYGATPRADLLPLSERDRRDNAALINKWAGWVVVVLLVVLAATGGTYYLQYTSEQRLVAEQAKTASILQELSQYSDVSTAIAQRSRLNAFRQQAMANDIEWQSLFVAINGMIPAGASLVEFDVTPGGVPASADDLSGVGVVVTTRVSSPTPLDHATLIEQFQTLPGVIGVDMVLLDTPQDPTLYEYTTDITFDQSVYSGKFTAGGAQ